MYKEQGSILLNSLPSSITICLDITRVIQLRSSLRLLASSRQIVIELGKLLRRTEPCSLYLFNTELVKIVSLLSLIHAIVEQANSLENRSNIYL